MKKINKFWSLALIAAFALVYSCNTNKTEDSYDDQQDTIENRNDMPDEDMNDTLRHIDSLEINSDTLAHTR